MKRIIPLLVLVCITVGIAIINSCKKDDVIPTLTTTALTNITTTSVTGGGLISKDGGATVTARGVCWGTASNPTVSRLPYIRWYRSRKFYKQYNRLDS